MIYFLSTGEDYNLSSITFNLVPGTSVYNLPTDFYKLKGVDLKIDNAQSIALKRYNFNERNLNNTLIFNGITNLRYRDENNTIKFTPKPSTTNEITVHYAPHAVKLSADSDTFNGYNGWEEYIIVNAAIFACKKGRI